MERGGKSGGGQFRADVLLRVMMKFFSMGGGDESGGLDGSGELEEWGEGEE